MLIYAIVFMNLALLFYTIGVWSEKLQGKLKKWHLGFFFIGLLWDTTGTLVMEKIANNSEQIVSGMNLHAVTGILAILLMLIHALWASIVLYTNNKNMMQRFHKFSILVWLIWLIPFLSGAISHMTN